MDKKEKQILEEMQQAQQARKEAAEKTGLTPRGGNIKEEKKPTGKEQIKQRREARQVPKDVRVKQLEEQLKDYKAKNADLEDQITNSNRMKSNREEQEALNSIIRNNDEYHFAKKYTITGANDKTKEIVVKMHAPSVSEQAEIQQDYADLTRGRGTGFAPGAQELFMAIAYYRVVGDNVPKWFTDIDHTYRADILLEVWNDYNEWLDQFLGTRFQ